MDAKLLILRNRNRLLKTKKSWRKLFVVHWKPSNHKLFQELLSTLRRYSLRWQLFWCQPDLNRKFSTETKILLSKKFSRVEKETTVPVLETVTHRTSAEPINDRNFSMSAPQTFQNVQKFKSRIKKIEQFSFVYVNIWQTDSTSSCPVKNAKISPSDSRWWIFKTVFTVALR